MRRLQAYVNDLKGLSTSSCLPSRLTSPTFSTIRHSICISISTAALTLPRYFCLPQQRALAAGDPSHG